MSNFQLSMQKGQNQSPLRLRAKPPKHETPHTKPVKKIRQRRLLDSPVVPGTQGRRRCFFVFWCFSVLVF